MNFRPLGCRPDALPAHIYCTVNYYINYSFGAVVMKFGTLSHNQNNFNLYGKYCSLFNVLWNPVSWRSISFCTKILNLEWMVTSLTGPLFMQASFSTAVCTVSGVGVGGPPPRFFLNFEHFYVCFNTYFFMHLGPDFSRVGHVFFASSIRKRINIRIKKKHFKNTLSPDIFFDLEWIEKKTIVNLRGSKIKEIKWTSARENLSSELPTM